MRRFLIGCGILAPALYVATDLLAANSYPAYHSYTARAVSELMARGAPTEKLVDPLFFFYGILMIGFSLGVWLFDERRRVHVTAGLLFAYASLGLLGPTLFEMNLRGSAPSTADALHLALTGVLVLLLFGAVLAGATIRGRGFLLYSYATVAIMLIFGALSAFGARGLATGEPTPWVGLLERINIGAFLAWSAVLSVSLLRATRPKPPEVRLPPPLLRVQRQEHLSSHGLRGAS